MALGSTAHPIIITSQPPSLGFPSGAACGLDFTPHQAAKTLSPQGNDLPGALSLVGKDPALCSSPTPARSGQDGWWVMEAGNKVGKGGRFHAVHFNGESWCELLWKCMKASLRGQSESPLTLISQGAAQTQWDMINSKFQLTPCCWVGGVADIHTV